MKKFRTFSNYEIREFTVLKETDKQITYLYSPGRELREAKESNYVSWHNTKEEAREYLIKIEKKKIEQHLSYVHQSRITIQKIKQI